MNQRHSVRGIDSQQSETVFQAANAVLAEHIKLILACCEIRAAVIHRDPMHLGAAVAEVIVASCDSGRAIFELANFSQANHPCDWRCAECGEDVPDNFDLCWNCGALHKSCALELIPILSSEEFECGTSLGSAST